MRKIFPRTKDVYRVPDWVPIVFVVLSGAIIISLTVFKPIYTVPGLLITVLGIPVYHYWDKAPKRKSGI